LVSRSLFEKKKIILGVTGSIAAYKAVDLANSLVKNGAKVRVVMTENASHFVTPLTFSTITGEPCIKSLFDSSETEIHHIELVKDAHAFLVAPATANFISKAANGIADDALTTFLLVARCPILIAPAMNTRMYLNSFVQENLEKLISKGFYILGPEEGKLACGEVGLGKMAEIERIVDYVKDIFSTFVKLEGKKFLITAGPTREYLDDIRFISNRSSGKMGHFLAQEAALMGARVTLISGPVSLPPPANVDFIRIESAEEMMKVCKKHFPKNEVLIMAAAVSDYRPQVRRRGKIKKEKDLSSLSLERTKDILRELSKVKKPRQIMVGFAAESRSLLNSARKKLKKKKLDLIVANPIDKEVGFESEFNQGYFIFSDGRVEEIKRLPKRIFARKLLQTVTTLLLEKS
jgi:phosphopantothenoylcysteine decarboxylase/phosphopantothenate--cysteine ligase